MAKIPKTIFGNQTANNGGKLDFSANVPKILSKNTNEKATAIPMAKLNPIPPLRFIDETATAISRPNQKFCSCLHLLLDGDRCHS